ncbi:alpha/beta hydrolase [Nocardioidaceae bacterium]|nr:alpha/beta hydrolase [Nocardioidaceae bacterium]
MLTQLGTAGLVANALAPPRGFRSGVAAFAPGWLVSELAPQLLAGQALDAALYLTWCRATGRTPDRLALALGAVNAAGLAWLSAEGQRARRVVDDALRVGLGAGWDEDLPAPATQTRQFAQQLLEGPRLSPRQTEGVHRHHDVRYSPAGKRGLLDVYYPDGEVRGAPVLLQVHGGAWTLGEKEHQGVPLMVHMAQQGWVCVALNYRLAPRDAWPAQVVDVKRALAWIREEIGTYGGDPSYVAITGGSAGGHLASLAALTPGKSDWQPGFEDADTSVTACVPHYGVYDMAGTSGSRHAARLRDEFLAERIFQRDPQQHMADYEEASPLLQVDADAPDFFVLHGGRDSLVDPGMAHAFVRRLREESQKAVVYAELPGAQHGFDVLPSVRSAHAVHGIERFLTWHHRRWQQAQRAAV